MAGNWIAGAIKKPGALHKEMGVPAGKKIPGAKLAKAAHAGGKLGQRARLAETLEGMPHGSTPKPPPPGHPAAPAQPGFRSKLSDVNTDRGKFSFKANRGAAK